jgi:hypothetical protein
VRPSRATTTPTPPDREISERERTVYDGRMAKPDAEHAYGTAALDAPATRAELERAIRNLHMSDLDLRDALLRLAARVVALTDELTRRIDGVEPLPAPPGTPAPPPSATVEAATEAGIEATLVAIRATRSSRPGYRSISAGWTARSTRCHRRRCRAPSSSRCAARGAAGYRSRCRPRISTRA